jgi:hypothetical protein
MSALGIGALVVGGLWLALLTMVAILLVRQVGLLTLRLDQSDQEAAMDGISVESPIPGAVVPLLPSAGSQLSFLIVLEATCGPCRTVVEDLHGAVIDAPVAVVIGGEPTAAAAMAGHLPASMQVAVGEPADVAITALDLKTSPFLFTFAQDRVAVKDTIRSAEHLVNLITTRNDAARARTNGSHLEVIHAGRA